MLEITFLENNWLIELAYFSATGTAFYSIFTTLSVLVDKSDWADLLILAHRCLWFSLLLFLCYELSPIVPLFGYIIRYILNLILSYSIKWNGTQSNLYQHLLCWLKTNQLRLRPIWKWIVTGVRTYSNPWGARRAPSGGERDSASCVWGRLSNASAIARAVFQLSVLWFGWFT